MMGGASGCSENRRDQCRNGASSPHFVGGTLEDPARLSAGKCVSPNAQASAEGVDTGKQRANCAERRQH